MPQVLTANRLVLGDVVYWGGESGWVSEFEKASVLNELDAKQALDGTAQSILKCEIVGPYLFDVRIQEGKTVPVKIREIIRAAGPTVRLDLGKQAG